MQRRVFLGLAGSSAISAVIPVSLQGLLIKQGFLPGLQLYTLRDAIAIDLLDVLKNVAHIGYKSVEAYPLKNKGLLFGMSPERFKAVLGDTGLSCTSTHIAYSTVDDKKSDPAYSSFTYDLEKLTDLLAEANIKYAFIGHPESEATDNGENIKRFTEQLQKGGELALKKGITIGLHNHANEFTTLVDGMPMLTYMLANTTKSAVAFELDIYWAAKAGVDPAEYLSAHPGRFRCWHIKDRYKVNGNTAEVGKGDINFDKVFAQASKSNLEYAFVEQDQCPQDPFVSIAQSLAYCKKKGWFKMS